MPDLEPSVLGDGGRADSAASSNPGNDPFSHLHKMSTTAGLGSTEYVAVNSPSVGAALLGLASALSLLNPVLLVIPLAGLVTGIVSIRQIRDSNGTQTGRGMAWIGMILSLAFLGIVAGAQVKEAMTARAERQFIADLVRQFDQTLRAGEYEKTYALFGKKFHDRVPLKEFSGRFKDMQASPYYGPLKSVGWNERLMFITDPQTHARYARGLLIFNFEKSASEIRQDVVFQKSDDRWILDDLAGLFPPPQPGGPGGAGPGPGMPTGP